MRGSDNRTGGGTPRCTRVFHTASTSDKETSGSAAIIVLPEVSDSVR